MKKMVTTLLILIAVTFSNNAVGAGSAENDKTSLVLEFKYAYRLSLIASSEQDAVVRSIDYIYIKVGHEKEKTLLVSFITENGSRKYLEVREHLVYTKLSKIKKRIKIGQKVRVGMYKDGDIVAVRPYVKVTKKLATVTKNHMGLRYRKSTQIFQVVTEDGKTYKGLMIINHDKDVLKIGEEVRIYVTKKGWIARLNRVD